MLYLHQIVPKFTLAQWYEWETPTEEESSFCSSFSSHCFLSWFCLVWSQNSLWNLYFSQSMNLPIPTCIFFVSIWPRAFVGFQGKRGKRLVMLFCSSHLYRLPCVEFGRIFSYDPRHLPWDALCVRGRTSNLNATSSESIFSLKQDKKLNRHTQQQQQEETEDVHIHGLPFIWH